MLEIGNFLAFSRPYDNPLDKYWVKGAKDTVIGALVFSD